MRFKTLREGYVDLRFGWGAVAPIFGFSNFVLLAYISVIKEVLPLEVFAPVFGVTMLFSLTALGKVFRKKQLKVDSTLNYEQQTEPAKTARVMFDDLHKIQDHLNIPISEESKERRNYMHDIENSKK